MRGAWTSDGTVCKEETLGAIDDEGGVARLGAARAGGLRAPPGRGRRGAPRRAGRDGVLDLQGSAGPPGGVAAVRASPARAGPRRRPTGTTLAGEARSAPRPGPDQSARLRSDPRPPLAATLRASRRTWDRLEEGLATLPEAALTDPGHFSWMEGKALGPAVVRDATAHFHQDHEAEVRAWLAWLAGRPAIG